VATALFALQPADLDPSSDRALIVSAEGAPQAPATRARIVRNALRGGAILIALLFIGLLAYGVINRAPKTGIDDSLAESRPVTAPGFELAVLHRGNLGPVLARRLRGALADGRVSLSDLRGTPVVLNFWASWCIPCREEAPLLQRTWRTQAGPAGVLFLGLDMQDLTGDARDFIRQFGIDYLNIRDPSNPVARRYQVTGVPETFFITAQGQIVGHVVGVTSAEQLRAGIAAARSGRTVGAQRGGDQKPVR
jgi:cytochrome c biogenesis protein CcmG, thiol:disulfide interchange protein DsbE